MRQTCRQEVYFRFLPTNLINPLKQENRLTTSLMLIRKIVAAYCENRKQRISTLHRVIEKDGRDLKPL